MSQPPFRTLGFTWSAVAIKQSYSSHCVLLGLDFEPDTSSDPLRHQGYIASLFSLAPIFSMASDGKFNMLVVSYFISSICIQRIYACWAFVSSFAAYVSKYDMCWRVLSMNAQMWGYMLLGLYTSCLYQIRWEVVIIYIGNPRWWVRQVSCKSS